jgi:polysaccharide export outer membrane protein
MALLAMLAGCGGSIISGAGPRIDPILDEDNQSGPVPYKLIDLNAETIGKYMRPAEATPTADVSKTISYAIRLVPGDALRVMIADSAIQGAIFAPLATGGTTFEVRVDAAGNISLPYAGKIHVADLAPDAVEREIRRRLKGVAADAQVMVSLVGDLSGSVLVAGAVKSPGRFSALQGPLTVLDAINLAGGPLLEPHLTKVTVRNGKNVWQATYQDVLDGKNMPVAPRSEIIVERARKRFVAMGAVQHTGLLDLPNQDPSLLEVLGLTGGLDEASADPKGVFVFRMSPPGGANGQSVAEVFRLNMRDPAAIFLARQFLVQPEDAIYVTNSAVHEWQKIISPIVQVLATERTIQRGF